MSYAPHLPPVMLTGATIDRADQIRVDDEQLAAQLNWRTKVLRLNGLDPDFDAEGRLVWSSLAECAEDSAFLFLGIQDGKPHFVELTAQAGPDGGPYNPRLWGALANLPADELGLYAGARSLVDWHRRHRFCANCGAPTAIRKGGWARQCGACNAEHFPRVDPVTIMLAEFTRDGVPRVLLGRQPRFPVKRLSALAGFVEPGESIEGAVARELFEEAGIHVKNVRYIASQPWPFPSSLMMACTSEAEDDALTLDETEIEEADWFTAEDVRAALDGDPDAPFIAPPPFAIAHNLLQWWLDDLKTR